MYISVWKRWDFQRAACICLFISILRKATSGWCGTCGGDSKWMMYEGRMMQWCFNFVPELPEVTEHSSFKSPPWSQSHSSVSWNSVNCWFWDPRHWKPPPPKKKHRDTFGSLQDPCDGVSSHMETPPKQVECLKQMIFGVLKLTILPVYDLNYVKSTLYIHPLFKKSGLHLGCLWTIVPSPPLLHAKQDNE